MALREWKLINGMEWEQFWIVWLFGVLPSKEETQILIGLVVCID